MPVENTAVRLVNEALLRLAAAEIVSFDEGTQKADICERSYDAVIAKLLTTRQWRWATRKFQLSRNATAPIAHWTYAFKIPAEAFNHDSPWAVYNSSANKSPPIREFEVFGAEIYANDPELWADFTIEPTVDKFPPTFRELVILALCEVLAPPITEQAELAIYWGVKAFGTPEEKGLGGYFKIAAQADARGSPSPKFYTGEIVDQRFS
jgi:hypothetical protein